MVKRSMPTILVHASIIENLQALANTLQFTISLMLIMNAGATIQLLVNMLIVLMLVLEINARADGATSRLMKHTDLGVERAPITLIRHNQQIPTEILVLATTIASHNDGRSAR